MAYASLHLKFCEIAVLNIPSQPPHFCKAIYDGDAKQKQKSSHPSFAYMYFLVSFKPGDKVVDTPLTYSILE